MSRFLGEFALWKTRQLQEINTAIYLNDRYFVRTLSPYGPNRSIV